jgi:hypothetical protein
VKIEAKKGKAILWLWFRAARKSGQQRGSTLIAKLIIAQKFWNLGLMTLKSILVQHQKITHSARHSLPNVMTRMGDHLAFLEDFVFLADIMAD